MPVDLYYARLSAPCRAVLLTVKALNLDLNLKVVDLLHDEHLQPEYLKLNPQHTVPTLVDDGQCLCESRVIMTYLVNKYAKGSPLYPEEPRARALVDQRLYFDIGTLYQRLWDYFFFHVYRGESADPEKLVKVEDALKLLDGFLDGQTYVAGPNLTLADLSIIAAVSICDIADIDFRKYSNVKRWFEHMKATVPGYKEIVEKGVHENKVFIEEYQKLKF